MYADSYTLSGCQTAEYCGVFHRVAAHCAGGDRCPGGRNARPGWSDATLCDGAPVFQRAGGGAMLYRYMWSTDMTQWFVADSVALGNCNPDRDYYSSRAISGSNPQPSLLPPDAVGYGWSDPGGYDDDHRHGTIHIVAGDGGGGGR